MLYPEKQHAAGRRRAGITKLANSHLGSAKVIKAARHKDCVINAVYQMETEEAHNQCHEVQRYKVSFIHFVVLFFSFSINIFLLRDPSQKNMQST